MAGKGDFFTPGGLIYKEEENRSLKTAFLTFSGTLLIDSEGAWAS